MGLVDQIAQTYRDIGASQADAQRRSGEIWGQTLYGLGQIASQIPQQRIQRQEAALRMKAMQQQVDATTNAQQAQARANQIYSQFPRTDDGTIDTLGLSQRFAQNNLPLDQQEKFIASADKMNQVIAGAAKDKRNRRADAANVLLGHHDENNPLTWDSVHLGAAALQDAGLMGSGDMDALVKAQASGADPKTFLENVRGMGDDYAKPKLTVLPEGASAINAQGQVVATAGAKPKDEFQTFKDAYAKNAGAAKFEDLTADQQLNATQAYQAAKANPDQAGADDRKYEAIQQAMTLKRPVSAEDTAWAGAYEKRKQIGPEASAAAAANRQTQTIAAQVAQQGRAQAFTESQAGRKELQDKVEQPFLDAREKADVLRGVVAAAKGGNMEAASVQSLLGTLGLVTTEGVKRINSVELENVAGAGNLWERLKGSVGGLTTGQKLSPKLQDDLLELSNKLEDSAYKKYQAGYTATTKRYGLKDEQPLPSPGASSAAPAGPAPNLSGLAKGQARTFNAGPFAGQTWTMGADGTPSRVK